MAMTTGAAPRQCATCLGRGRLPIGSDRWATCHRCGGLGWLWYRQVDEDPAAWARWFRALYDREASD